MGEFSDTSRLFHLFGGILPACSACFLMFGDDIIFGKARELASAARWGLVAPLKVAHISDRLLLATVAAVEESPAVYLSLLRTLLHSKEPIDPVFIACLSVFGRYVFTSKRTRTTAAREVSDIILNKKFNIFQDAVFADDQFKDVTLKIHDMHGQVVAHRAHRLVLAHNAEFFKTFFVSSFSDSQCREVDIKDVDVMLFQQFVEFCYGDTKIASPQNALDLLYLSERLLCSELKGACAFYLLSTASEPTILLELWEVVSSLPDDDNIKIGCEEKLVNFVLTNLVVWSGEVGEKLRALPNLLDVLSRGLKRIAGIL